MNDDCTHGDDYLFSPPGSDELHCGLCLLARVAESERREAVSSQLVADLACGHGAVVEHRAALERVAELEAEVARLRADHPAGAGKKVPQ